MRDPFALLATFHTAAVFGIEAMPTVGAGPLSSTRTESGGRIKNVRFVLTVLLFTLNGALTLTGVVEFSTTTFTGLLGKPSKARAAPEFALLIRL